MQQQSMASQGVFGKYGRKSRRELFLDEMEQIVPWPGLESLVRPHYVKAAKGRQSDETTVLRFRHLLEKHDLGGLMLETVNVHLEARGIKIATGTIVDATILHAPSSTRNASGIFGFDKVRSYGRTESLGSPLAYMWVLASTAYWPPKGILLRILSARPIRSKILSGK